MNLTMRIRRRIKAGRERRVVWVRLLDVLRLAVTAEGRARLLTLILYRVEVHQTTPYTAEERYPELFEFAASTAPNARRILSFGCSTGEELSALRLRFPAAEIVGAEINPRSRRIAAMRMASDAGTMVIRTPSLAGRFDMIFALAVFQREPHKVEEMKLQDLSLWYGFDRFDATVGDLVDRLEPGGIMCVIHNQYRIEDLSVISDLLPIQQSPESPGPFFARDGRRLTTATARTVFRKRD